MNDAHWLRQLHSYGLLRGNAERTTPETPLPAVRHAKARNEPTFDARPALYALLGADLTQIHGFGPYTVLRLVAECGDDMSKWPTAKHCTSWLSLAPGNKGSGGRLAANRGGETQVSTKSGQVQLQYATCMWTVPGDPRATLRSLATGSAGAYALT